MWLSVRLWAGVSGGGVASELGLTNIQDPCVIPMKKFGLCASDAGELGSRMTWVVTTLERLYLALGENAGLGPPETGIAVTGLPAWVMRIW